MEIISDFHGFVRFGGGDVGCRRGVGLKRPDLRERAFVPQPQNERRRGNLK